MTNPPTPTMDRWAELERLAKAAYEDYPDDAVRGTGPSGRVRTFIEATDPATILDLITSARSGGGDVVELREALETISEGGPDRVILKDTYKHGFDQGCAWAGRIARAALSRIEAGGGSGSNRKGDLPTEQADRAVVGARP